MADNKLNIRVEMQGEMLERFKKVQALLGIESGTDVFRYLVSDCYHQRIKPLAERDVKAAGGNRWNLTAVTQSAEVGFKSPC